MKYLLAAILLFADMSLEDIILDIYRAVTELGETEYEQLQSDLYALHETPVNLNNTTAEELEQLYFLSPKQIDDILLYAGRHPFVSLYELRMIPSLEEYDIRNMLPFVCAGAGAPEHQLYAREVFARASHEIVTRIDARNIEGFEGTDPVYMQTRYRFDFQRRVTFGAQLRRPPGGGAKDLQYGAYLQLRDIGCLHTLVAGNFQASFGQGLVLASPFHSGKTAYIRSVGQTQEGLRYYSSVDGGGLHGTGATLRWQWNAHTRLDATALYSMKRANDSTWHHVAGANITLRHKRLQMQLTAVENIWSDSIRPYRNAAYNQHYFRGYSQAVIGAAARYTHSWFDAFCEVAAAQNAQWGFGLIAGSRFYPADGVSLIALYRWYSPWYDNALGYAFSETSRIGDENGGYIGFDISRWRNWRVSAYADVFRFSYPKYGIPQYPTLGFDALADIQYIRQAWRIGLRLRTRRKGDTDTYSARLQADISHNAWRFRTTADANMVNSSPAPASPSPALSPSLSYGFSLAQDISYTFPVPLVLDFRLQYFDAREWVNRIYLYEHDVLYAYSIPAVYGIGGRAYACLRWHIIPALSLSFRLSETIYTPAWASEHKRSITRTDLHFLLRATF